MNYFFTSECVSEGHPDKVADQISDAILDAYLRVDPDSHVACETMVTEDSVIISGEVRSIARPHIDSIVRNKVREIGYVYDGIGFDYNSLSIINKLHSQSRDIAMGVRQGAEDQGAGDQGMMFGFASNETKSLMPLTHDLACRIMRQLTFMRKNTGLMPYLRPDAKSQVTVEYKDGRPVHIDTIVVSTQHCVFETTDTAMQRKLEADIRRYVLEPIVENDKSLTGLYDASTKLYVNPTGRFVEGGPAADTGLTGRKIIVDTYGGHGAHGGGAFSGKDPSKVDRSAAYMARYIAKNLVAAGIADRMLIQLSYAIGVAQPISIFVNTYGTGHGYTDEEIAERISLLYDLTPHGIERELSLRNTLYQETAAGCHFGHEYKFDGGYEHYPWERIDDTTGEAFKDIK